MCTYITAKAIWAGCAVMQTIIHLISSHGFNSCCRAMLLSAPIDDVYVLLQREMAPSSNPSFEFARKVRQLWTGAPKQQCQYTTNTGR